MRYAVFVIAGSMSLAACATNADDRGLASNPADAAVDAQPPPVDGGTSDAGAGDADVRERAPACGDAGYCETKLPKSDQGMPLSLRGIWVVDSNDVWSVTVEGAVLHYDGTSWSTVYRANHPLYSVWGTANGVWVGGIGGLLLHGTVNGPWDRIETGHVESIFAIAGMADDDVWFMSRGDSVDHFDGRGLTNHRIGVTGLRITTLFARAEGGAYAAGYVPGPLTQTDTGPVVANEGHLFELTSTAILPIQALLSEQKGFVPIAGAVTDAPTDEHRFFLLGAVDDGFQAYRLRTARFGRVGPISLRIVNAPLFSELGFARPAADPLSSMLLPIWASKWNDILHPSAKYGLVVHWGESAFTLTSLPMGYDFPSSTIFGVHGNAKDTWMVGDGFALKGPTQ